MPRQILALQVEVLQEFLVSSAKIQRSALQLFIISFLALYFELIVIRWLSSEVRIFAYLKNLPLIASFLGLGLGCANRDHFPTVSDF